MHPIPRLGASGHSKAFHLEFSWATQPHGEGGYVTLLEG